MLPMNDRRIYFEKDPSGRPIVYLSSTGETWTTWSKTAADLRRKCGEVNVGILGPTYIGQPALKTEPQYLAQEHLPHCWRPVVNIAVTSEDEWTKEVQAAQEACMRTESEYRRTGQLPTEDLYHIAGPDSGETIDRDAWRPQEDSLVTALLRRLNGEEKTERNTTATRPACYRPPYEPRYEKRLTSSRPATSKVINTAGPRRDGGKDR